MVVDLSSAFLFRLQILEPLSLDDSVFAYRASPAILLVGIKPVRRESSALDNPGLHS